MKYRCEHDIVYWVQKQQFELPELKIIMDAIQSSFLETKLINC